MDLATVLSIVQTIFSAIQTLDQFKATFSLSDIKRGLADFEKTINAVKSVLEDAEGKQDVLNHQQTNYIEELKDAIYDADDVLDEFVTLVKRKQFITEANQAHHKLSSKVRSFVSRFKGRTHNLSNKLKDVNKKLNAIASNSSKFMFKVDNKPVRFIKQETSSFVSSEDIIIGRGEDVEKIVGILLDSDGVHQPNNVLSLAIVGMGGLGKTAFAQVVYNDPRVTSAFQLRCWTCIADQDQEQWNLTELLGKVVRELPLSDTNHLTSLEKIHLEIRKQLGGKKYLLVLDDVWTESFQRWQDLAKFLMVGESGSRIVITTRSKKTAQIVGGILVHELRGLSEEESWCLFERMAFLPEQNQNPEDDLVQLGKEIAKKCTNVPLAIRAVGSLLRGESKNKWASFREKELADISGSDDNINNILKLSYHNLDSPLKSCFAYCAIFPKDFVINKQLLISLWMVQGYINIDTVGEEYFLLLLQRGFFQDVIENEWGEIKSFKIHDLWHDIAEQVVGGVICRLNSNTLSVGEKVRHLNLLYGAHAQGISNRTRIRTYHQVEGWMGEMDKLTPDESIENWTCLRSLDLSSLTFKFLPQSIGKLVHLRYSNLAENDSLEELPESITKLVNLQTLNLYRCSRLYKLPTDMSQLVDLSTLNISSCGYLRDMPLGMGMLTRLHTLGLFLVGRKSSEGKYCFDGLTELHSLNNLKGCLDICIRGDANASYVKEDHGGGAFLRSKEHLKRIAFEFEHYEDRNMEYQQALLEEMQPHHNLRELTLDGYHGDTMPRWPRRGDNSKLFHLPNLVSLDIIDCENVQSLFSLSKLPQLKKLTLRGLDSVEYLVIVKPEILSSSERSSLFPCLEDLGCYNLPNLKGLWPISDSGVKNGDLIWESSTCFAQLKKLSTTDCRRLEVIPICPRLESVRINDNSYRFPNHTRDLTWMNMSHIPADYQSLLPAYSKERILELSHLGWLSDMPAEYFQCLAAIEIKDKEVLTLAEARELFQTSILPYMRFVTFYQCYNLWSDGGWLTQLSALHSLHIYECCNVLDIIPWQQLSSSLQCLWLDTLEKMEELPEGMQYCTSLRSLIIQYCPALDYLPTWMPNLTSLRKLVIYTCSKTLNERCRSPYGPDWLLIRHIPSISVREIDEDDEYCYFCDDDESHMWN